LFAEQTENAYAANVSKPGSDASSTTHGNSRFHIGFYQDAYFTVTAKEKFNSVVSIWSMGINFDLP
jgi:hypothetical protein